MAASIDSNFVDTPSNSALAFQAWPLAHSTFPEVSRPTRMLVFRHEATSSSNQTSHHRLSLPPADQIGVVHCPMKLQQWQRRRGRGRGNQD